MSAASRTVELAEVATIERRTVKPAALDPDVRYVGLEHITGDGGFDDPPFVVEVDIQSNKFAFDESHILYGKLRPYLSKIAAPPFAGVCSTDILPVRPGPEVHRRYLLHVLRMPTMIQHANRLAVGANLPRLSPKSLATFPIPLPPMEQQRRIAAVLDAADGLRAKRREALAKLDNLTRAIFVHMFGDGESWQTNSNSYSLGELEDAGFVELGRGRVISRKDMEADPGDYPVYSSAGLLNGQFGRYGKYMFDEELVTWSVDGGGHLFYRPRHRFSVTNVGGWIRVLDKSRLCTRYLHSALALLHSRLTFDWTQKAHSSVVRRVYASVLIPPLAEQLDFAERVGAVEEISERMKGEGRVLDQLVASLQQQAFRGEL